jgi:putative addiction module component (TIGR02574 family)
MKAPFAELFTLDIDERLQLVEDLWDSIAKEAVPGALSETQIEELRRRRAAHLSNPDSGSRSWPEIMERTRSRHAELRSQA